MPQMAPLSWLMLFAYFIFLFLLINPMNYFLFTKPTKKQSLYSTTPKTNWKW